METWVQCLQSASGENRRQSKKGLENKKMQPNETKIDKMLSDLVVYCQTVPFDFEGKTELAVVLFSWNALPLPSLLLYF